MTSTRAEATEAGTRFDFFVGCAQEDRDWVEGYLLPGLREAGARCLDESQFKLGPPTLKLFAEAVEQSDRVVLVVSPAFLADARLEWVRWLAAHYGQEHGTWPVVSLVLEDVTLPPELSMAGRVDMMDQDLWEEGLKGLIKDLERRLPGPLPAPPPCPYPGLLPFTAKAPGTGKQSYTFRGRDAEIDEVVERLRVHPLLAVIGTSGSGKSSLLHAGVEVRLKDNHRVLSIRPGRTPTATLAAAVEKAHRSRRPVVLIIDQFEELFTLPRGHDADSSEVATFCADLLRLIDRATSDATRCIIALRADYYPQLMTCPLWDRVRAHRFELLPLRGDQLRDAIQVPASEVYVHIEAALVEALVRDAAGEPGSLPLVQETLVSLWGHLRRRYLPLSAYDALVLPGLAYGEPPRTGLQVALARHAEATVSSLSEDDQTTARRIFLRLVQLMDDREDVRRPQRRRELESEDRPSESVDRVLRSLIDARLVTPAADEHTADPRETLIDLAHEAIISGWPSLRAWISERRDAERARRKLEGMAAEWVRLGRSGGGLLDEVELAEVEAWLSGPDASELGTTADLEEFVAVSRRTLDTARAGKARQDRMFRILSAALAVLLVAVGVSAIIAVGQRNEAEEGRAVARSNQLGLAAESMSPEQLDRALLLGQEGLSLRRTRLTVGGALATLNSNPRVERTLHVQVPQLAVAVAGNGTTAVSGGQDGIVRVWDLAKGGAARELGSMNGEIRSIAVSPVGATVAASSSTGAVGQWDVGTGQRVQWTSAPATSTEIGHQGSVRAIAYSPDGSVLATAGEDGQLIVRQAKSGHAQHVLGGYRDWLNAVAFTPDGRLLAVAGGRTEGRSTDRRILLWDVRAGRLLARMPGHDDAVRSLAVSPDGTVLASAGAEGSIKLWSLPDGRPLRQLTGHKDRVFAVAFSPDGKLLASAGRDHSVRIWNPASGKPTLDPLLGHGDAVRGVAFAGEDRVVSVGNDNRVIVWNVGQVPRARLAAPLVDQSLTTRAVGVDPTGTLIATGDDSGRVVVRRATDGMPTGVVVEAGAPVSGIALGPRSTLVTATYDGRLRVWDARSGVARTPMKETGEGSLVLALSADGQTVATGGDSNIVRLWDLTLRQTAELVGHRNWVRALAFTPQSAGQDDALVSAGADGVAYLWKHLATDAKPTALGQRSSLIESLAISPDGKTIATGNAEGQVILWDTLESDVRPSDQPRLTGHAGTVVAIAYSPSGDTLLTADAGGTVRVWEPGSGLEELGTLGRVGALSRLVVVSDQRAFSVGAGGPARWALDQREWRRIACATAGRNLRVEEAASYGFSTPPRTCPGGP